MTRTQAIRSNEMRLLADYRKRLERAEKKIAKLEEKLAASKKPKIIEVRVPDWHGLVFFQCKKCKTGYGWDFK